MRYVRKNTLLAAKGGAFAPPLPPLNPPLVPGTVFLGRVCTASASDGEAGQQSG